jgi:hypothetical protein
MLRRFGRVRGVEMDREARTVAIAGHMNEIADGHLPEQIPFGPEKLDLVTLLDVLERVQEDGTSVRLIAERLNPYPTGWGGL